jgi:hypothetical protein
LKTTLRFTWSDAWLLLSVALAATRGHGTLEEVISWGDVVNHAVFTGPELRRGFAKLIAAGHVTRDEGFDVSEEVRRIVVDRERGAGPRDVQKALERFLDADPYPAGHPRFEDPEWPFPELTDAMVMKAFKAYRKRIRRRAQ